MIDFTSSPPRYIWLIRLILLIVIVLWINSENQIIERIFQPQVYWQGEVKKIERGLDLELTLLKLIEEQASGLVKRTEDEISKRIDSLISRGFSDEVANDIVIGSREIAREAYQKMAESMAESIEKMQQDLDEAKRRLQSYLE